MAFEFFQCFEPMLNAIVQFTVHNTKHLFIFLFFLFIYMWNMFNLIMTMHTLSDTKSCLS